MSEDTVVLTIYCNHKEQTGQTLLNLLGSLWKQLVLRKRTVTKSLLEQYEKHTKQQSRPTVDELVNQIVQELQGIQRAYIVIDALDECKRDIMERLVYSVRSISEKCRLLFTSRELLDIEELLNGFHRLDIKADTKDMEDYIYGRMYPGSRIIKLIDSSRPDNIQRDTVKDKVIARAAGM
jgi:hypothetical protein